MGKKKNASAADDEAKVMLSIRISETEMAGLHRESERLGVSVTTLARAAIRDAVGLPSVLRTAIADAKTVIEEATRVLEHSREQGMEVEAAMREARDLRDFLAAKKAAAEKRPRRRR